MNLRGMLVDVQHFLERAILDGEFTLWGGFVLEISDKTLYLGGDSGDAEHHQKTFDRFGAVD